MALRTFAEIQPVMEACTRAEVTAHGAPWDDNRTMVGTDATKCYYLTVDEYRAACNRIAGDFNTWSGNKAAGIPADLSDKAWQDQYTGKSVKRFISAASNKAEDQANPTGGRPGV